MTVAKVKRWTVDIDIVEDGDGRQTYAKALLMTDIPHAASVRGDGTAWRNRYDEDLPELGDELAVGRALFELSRRLIERAGSNLERAPA